MNEQKTNEFTQKEEGVVEKKTYTPPVLEVLEVEMECGVAAASATLSPSVTNGNVDPVQTNWTGDDSTEVVTPF
ncbi:hypothetical protein [Elizabethkingia anophelis]|uniref:hypothetical protein n=1 Tax=Elizabethkingia anophelis TaxID=1117645 RepID=UPI0021A30B66|nr:hypothetical protein [Elizabethkingia anophelis]